MGGNVGDPVEGCPMQKKGWIEIEMVDDSERPVPGERYQVELPDGFIREGTLDDNGLARLEGIEEGSCKVSFPNVDADAWKRK